jgi:DNA-binding Lrp family transcriptional regulator
MMPPVSLDIDDTDRRILAALQQNARVSLRALAEELAIAPSTCHQRVRSLQDRGVVRGYHAEVDLAAIGRAVQAIIAIRFRPHSRKHVEPFYEAVTGLDETLSVTHVSGSEDFLLHVAVRDIEHLRDFILDQLTVRSEVGVVQTMVVYEERRNRIVAPLEP